MKPRRVIVTIEMETGLTGADLKDFYKDADVIWSETVKIHQVQVNVIQKKKPRAKK